MIPATLHAGIAPAGAEPGRIDRPARTTYRRLRLAGLDAAQAGNLTAHLAGLRATPRGWTVHEIESLLFVRSLVDGGKLRS
jgi:hypothetical protein